MVKFLFYLDNSLSKSHKNLLFLFYFVLIFILNYILYSSEDYLSGSLEKISSSVENKEVVEMTQLGMNEITKNPAMLLLLSLQPVSRSIYSIVLLIVFCWLAISYYSDKWTKIVNIYYQMSSVVVVLIIGITINFIFMYLTYNPISVFEFGNYFGYFSLHPFIKKLSKGYELFTILFLLSFSKVVSVYYQEKFFTIFLLVNLFWLIIILISYFLGFGVGLIL